MKRIGMLLVPVIFAGCASNHRVEKSQDDFLPETQVRDVDRIMAAQVEAGAAEDATLYPYQFRDGALTASGRQKIAMIVRHAEHNIDRDSSAQTVIYIHPGSDSAAADSRTQIVSTYLQHRNMHNVTIKVGDNPDALASASIAARGLDKTDSDYKGTEKSPSPLLGGTDNGGGVAPSRDNSQ